MLRAELESPLAAFVAATSANADILGIAGEVGSRPISSRSPETCWDHAGCCPERRTGN